MSFMYCRCDGRSSSTTQGGLEFYLFMPLSLSFPLHFGAKKRQESGAEAAWIRLALIALLVRLDCLVSGNV